VTEATGLTAVSLFAGIGGFDLALKRAGVTMRALVEIDAACRGVLALHYPETRQFTDVTEVTSGQLRAAGFVPGRGILAGGWPCQDLSIAGMRAGLGGARSGLFWEIVRLAGELLPRWLVLENVPGLLSAACPCPGDGTCIRTGRADRCGRWVKRHGQQTWQPAVIHTPDGGACPGGCMPSHGGAMGTVVGALEQLGYGLAWRVLDAQHFGLAQQRERLFFVGCLGDGAAPAEVLFDPESSGGDSPPRGKAWEDIAATLGSRIGGARTTDLVSTLAGTGPGGGWRCGADEAAAGQLVVSTIQGGGRRGHRIDAEGAAGGHLIAAPAGVRRLTPRERERLQGFPDDWTRWRLQGGRRVEQSDSARDRQTGNAVAVPVVEWIGRRLAAAGATLTRTGTAA
jgi:DNA (cytosine-5)-methyltransferase 1